MWSMRKHFKSAILLCCYTVTYSCVLLFRRSRAGCSDGGLRLRTDSGVALLRGGCFHFTFAALQNVRMGCSTKSTLLQAD